MKRSRLGNFLGLLLFLTLLESHIYGQTGSDATRKLELLKAYPDLIVVNGKIHTMDGRLSQVQAMAVRNNRILTLGTNDEVRFLAGPKTEVLDAKGRVIVPALIDSHTHPNLWGVPHWLGARGQDIAKEYNMPELASVLVRGDDAATLLRGIEQAAQRRAKELGPGKWIVVYLFGGPGKTLEDTNKIVSPMLPRAGGGGEGGGDFATGGSSNAPLTRQFLDTIAPNNPMIVFTGGGTGGNVHNTKAKDVWVRVIGNEQTQGLMESPQLLWEILLEGRPDLQTAIMKRELLECIAGQGIGTFADRYDRSTGSARIFRLLYERGELPVRWGYFVSSGSNTVGKYLKMESPSYDRATVADFVQRMLTHEIPDFRGIGNDYIWYAGTANEAWEGGLSCTKAELPSAKPPQQEVWQPRKDCAAPIDYEEQEGYRIEKEIMEKGLRMGFLHGYSDGTFDALFHMLDKAVADGKLTVEQIRAMRIGTEHNPIIRPDQAAQFGKYNLHPSFNGYQVQGDIKGGAFLQTYGEKYVSWMAPLKTLVDAGTHVVFNTDAHLTDLGPEWKSMESPEQWRGSIWAIMEFFITRLMPANKTYFPATGLTYAKSEALDKTTMLKAATIWSAELLLREQEIGSLEVGKLADFQVLDKDYFAIPDDQVHTVKTLLTAVGGKIVFRSPNY